MTQDDARRAAEFCELVNKADSLVIEHDSGYLCTRGDAELLTWIRGHRAEIAAALKHLATPAAQPAPAESREAFEAQHPGWDFEKDALGNYFSERTKWGWSEWQNGAAFQAARAGTAQGADWVLVPREPTVEMVEAGRAALSQGDTKVQTHARTMWCYEAMLSATPVQGERAGLSAEERQRLERVRDRANHETMRLDRREDLQCVLAIIDRLAPTPPHSPDGERE